MRGGKKNNIVRHRLIDTKWLDITSELTNQGIQNLKTGQVLFFDNNTEYGIQLRIMRKTKNKVWAKQVYMYKPEEVFTK